MSTEPTGNIEYIIDGTDETISYDACDLKITKNHEEYSKPSFKEDSTEYLTEYELNTDQGKFVWQTIESVSVHGIKSETELIEQPDNIEIMKNINFEYIENNDI